METKVCSACKQEKIVDDFTWKSKEKGTRQGRCKPCQQEYNRAYYHKKDKQKQVARVMMAKKKVSEQYREWKSKQSCEICGENSPECLDLHHIDPNEKEYEISRALVSKTWNKLQEEIAKCAVLCSNCHRKVHSGRIEYPPVV